MCVHLCVDVSESCGGTRTRVHHHAWAASAEIPRGHKLGLTFPFSASQVKGWTPSILGQEYVQVVIFI